MITKIVYDALNDPKWTLKQKSDFINNIGLSYSELLILEDEYESRPDIYNMLHEKVIYTDSKLENKIKKQNKDLIKSRRKKQKRAGINYEKHKRRY